MTGVRLGPELREPLDLAAAQENRSRADIIREAIVDWLKSKGYLK